MAAADALMVRTLPPEKLRSAVRTLKVSARLDLAELSAQLTAAGYTRCEQVEGVGQFAVRGGILDVFSPLMDQPVRCELFDDEYLKEKLDRVCEVKNLLLEHVYHKPALDVDELFEYMLKLRELVRPYVADTGKIIRKDQRKEYHSNPVERGRN